MTALPTTTERTRPEHEILLAGLVGGVIKLAVDTALAPLLLLRPLAVLRAIAAIVLGPRAAAAQGGLGAGEVALALLVHFALSLACAYPLVMGVRRMRRGPGVAVGVAYGVVLYLLGFYVCTIAFPWFAALRGFPQLFSHALFGATVALVFFALHPPPTLEERGPTPTRGGGPMVY